MKYHFTKHLIKRLLTRDIGESDISACLDNYRSDYPCKGKKHCHYYVGDIKGRNLKVLVDNTKKAIVTAFWLDS
jgi:hypothetical protein